MNNYDKWNKIKKETQEKNIKNFTVKPKEIYWTKIGLNIGNEQYGKDENFARPVIVIRQLTSDLFLGVPTTTKTKENSQYFHKINYTDNMSREINASAIILQQRVFSKKRLINKIGKIDSENFSQIVDKLRDLAVNPTP